MIVNRDAHAHQLDGHHVRDHVWLHRCMCIRLRIARRLQDQTFLTFHIGQLCDVVHSAPHCHSDDQRPKRKDWPGRATNTPNTLLTRAIHERNTPLPKMLAISVGVCVCVCVCGEQDNVDQRVTHTVRGSPSRTLSTLRTHGRADSMPNRQRDAAAADGIAAAVAVPGQVSAPFH